MKHLKTVFLNFTYLKDLFIYEIKKLTAERELPKELLKKKHTFVKKSPDPELYNNYIKLCEPKLQTTENNVKG
jgi:hypothetical protein